MRGHALLGSGAFDVERLGKEASGLTKEVTGKQCWAKGLSNEGRALKEPPLSIAHRELSAALTAVLPERVCAFFSVYLLGYLWKPPDVREDR